MVLEGGARNCSKRLNLIFMGAVPGWHGLTPSGSELPVSGNVQAAVEQLLAEYVVQFSCLGWPPCLPHPSTQSVEDPVNPPFLDLQAFGPAGSVFLSPVAQVLPLTPTSDWSSHRDLLDWSPRRAPRLPTSTPAPWPLTMGPTVQAHPPPLPGRPPCPQDAEFVSQ